jgi:hypothetical protein
VKLVSMGSIMLYLLRVTTSESMIPRPCFQALNTVYIQFYYMFACSDIYFRLHLLLIIITTTCISLSLRQTSAPIYLQVYWVCWGHKRFLYRNCRVA